MPKQKTKSAKNKTKPCETGSNEEFNCLICQFFNECQGVESADRKIELKLDDDY